MPTPNSENDPQVDLAFNGYVNLDREQRAKMIGMINEYTHANAAERGRKKRIINECTASVVLGPTGPTCPCCGR